MIRRVLLAVLLCTRLFVSEPAGLPDGVRRLSDPPGGLENLFALTPQLYSSSSPETEQSFRELQRLGIKTIISVDGAPPHVELARKHGIRYVHLPMGYNGTTADNALRLVKAAESSSGPVLVHCHHGKHRGPAAAALIARGLQHWSGEEAAQYLKTAGTSSDYPGLFAQVRTFQPSSADELRRVSTNFPERAKVAGIVDAMVQIDHTWEQLKAARPTGFAAPPNHPDLVPAREALMLAEAFREFLRSGDAATLDPDLLARMKTSDKAAWRFAQLLKGNPSPLPAAAARSADALWKQLSESCVSCHKTHRN